MKSQEFIYNISPSDIDTIKMYGISGNDMPVERYSDDAKKRLFILFDMARLIRDKKLTGVKIGDKQYVGDVLSERVLDGVGSSSISGSIAPKYIKMYDPSQNNWRMVDSNGYARIYKDKPTWKNYTEFVYEHRDIIEKTLNRKLKTEEVIHHVNARRDFNPSHNLELVQDKHQHVMEKHPEWLKKKKE